MNIAFLFNRDEPEYGASYGFPIAKKIIGSGILQRATRHMRVSTGDIDFSQSLSGFQPQIFQPKIWDKRIISRLESTYNQAVVYCWLFQNMTTNLGEQLHEALKNDSTYLGALDVDFSNPLQYRCFKTRLCEQYRVNGTQVRIFYSKICDEEPDYAKKEYFEPFEFNVSFEDTGARLTFFNDFDGIEHFQRIAEIQNIILRIPNWSNDEVAELSLNLEELHPYLFNILFAVARSYEQSVVIENISQALFSGRRFIEHLADFLFPPQDDPFISTDGNIREIGKDKYKNRIWAYIETILNSTHQKDASHLLQKLGREVDRLYELFCAGVHKPYSDEKNFRGLKLEARESISSLCKWLSSVILIDPDAIRKPYEPYKSTILDFCREVAKEGAVP